MIAKTLKIKHFRRIIRIRSLSSVKNRGNIKNNQNSLSLNFDDRSSNRVMIETKERIGCSTY